MGLDSYIKVIPRMEGYSFTELTDNNSDLDVETIEKFYWRGANHIHDWFIYNTWYGLQPEEDLVYIMDAVDIDELLTLTTAVLEDTMTVGLEETEKKYFRVQASFVDTQGDEDWYFQTLLELKDALTKLITEMELDEVYVYYYASY